MVQTDNGSASRRHTRNPHLYPVCGSGRHRRHGNTFMSSSQDRDQTESTGPESTVAGRPAPEATAPEATVPETTVPEDVGKPIEGAEEATVVVHEEPKEPGKGDPGAGNYGGIQDDNRI